MHHVQRAKLDARGVVGDRPYLHMIAAVGAPSDQFEPTDNATEHDVVNLDWMEDALLRNGTSEHVAKFTDDACIRNDGS